MLASPEGKVLGLRVVGAQAGTCVQGVALLIGQGGTIEQVEVPATFFVVGKRTEAHPELVARMAR